MSKEKSSLLNFHSIKAASRRIAEFAESDRIFVFIELEELKEHEEIRPDYLEELKE